MLNDIVQEIEKRMPKDAAEILLRLDEETRRNVLKRLSEETIANILPEIDESIRGKIFLEIPLDKAKRIFLQLKSDERVDLLQTIPRELQDIFLEILPRKEAEEIEYLKKYPKGTVGSIMTKEFIALNENMLVDDAIRYIRENAKKFETIYYTYVIDSNNKLKGVLSLRELLLADGGKCLKDVMKKNVIKVRPEDDQEFAARLMKDYNLAALPVVSDDEKLIGIVTYDDIFEVLDEERGEDIIKIGGSQTIEESYKYSSVTELYKRRIVWLIVLLIGEIIVSLNLKFFEENLINFIALTFFLPLILASAGNAGSQSATLIIRGLILEEISIKDGLIIIRKELLQGFLIGITLGIITLPISYLISGSFKLSFAIFLGAMATIMISCIYGGVLPLIAKRLRLDPAIVSTPFVTTLSDVIGTVTYLTVSSIILLYF